MMSHSVEMPLQIAFIYLFIFNYKNSAKPSTSRLPILEYTATSHKVRIPFPNICTDMYRPGMGGLHCTRNACP
jgi:hypothetical protein